jgi:predicted transcriptional regulator
VFARIVKTLKEKGATNRTALATATGLSYDRLIRYLDWMTEKGFVRLDGDGLVQLTRSGSEAYNGLVSWIIEHVGSLKLSRLRSEI